jgi:polysaccharide biosynthesis protein PslG
VRPRASIRRLRDPVGVRRASLQRPLASLLAVALLTGAAIAGCAGNAGSVTVPRPPAGAPPLHAGLVLDALDDVGRSRAAELARARALGIGWIREELRWRSIEPAPGRFRWGRFDALVTAATRARLHVLPLLLGTPAWAGPSPLALPDDPAAFGAFAARAAARYGPGGSFWRTHRRLDARYAPQWFELWNEPYTIQYSSGGVDPVRYAAMVHAATAAGHAANPATRWLMAADLTYQDPSGARRNWLEALTAADPGLLGLVDGVAVHPYMYGSPDGAHGIPLPFRFDRVNAIAGELTRLGAPRTPLWITEIGWSTCDARPACGSERDQAQWLADVFTRVRRRPLSDRVRALFVYHLHDFPGRATGDKEAHFGLLRTNGSRKPAWSVVRREALLAGG